MKTTAATTIASGQNKHSVHGTVRDDYQRPFEGALVRVFDKDLRSEQSLGETRTGEAGTYKVEYDHKQFAATDKPSVNIIVRAYGQDGKLLKESDTCFNAPAQLQVDIDLSSRSYPGPSEFDQTVKSVKPFTGKLPLSRLTEDQKNQDITFLTNKTGLPRARIEALAMAFRFEKSTRIQARVFYGLIRQGPSNNTFIRLASISSATTFDSKASQTFGVLMRESIDTLMASVQGAIDSNIISYSVTADLARIKEELIAQQQLYIKDNPGPVAPSNLTLKLNIAGLQGNQVSTFISLFANAGSQQDFWKTLANNPAFQTQKVALLQSVFSLSRLTGEQMVLTDQLIKAENIQAPADLPKLAAKTSMDWVAVLRTSKIKPPAGVPGQNSAEKMQNYAAELEQNFTAAFPSAAFAARMKNDSQSKIPNASGISRFLNANPDFDLLTTRIGQYLQTVSPSVGTATVPVTGTTSPKGTPPASSGGATPATDVPDTSVPFADAPFLNQLKRTQRVFKLSPTYAAANLLLRDNIDSAQKIYRMGQGNFAAKYGPQLGVAEAGRVFQKAKQAYSQALVLLGNLKSMSDASHLNVFPDYTRIISDAMTVEVPDLDTLFGHTDFCECEECRSVYGAAAYLTDTLHYLDNRMTSITCAPKETASVKEALLRRRPDIGDIDLECANTNTEIPYIDIANELMEDSILAPAVSLKSSYLPKFVPGTIDPGLFSEILSQFKTSGQTNISGDANIAPLLTSKAIVSDKYQAERLKDDDTCATEDHWIIRDQFVVLKATDQGTGISVQLLHQTLLPSDEINANPEYVNIPAYNTLGAAKRPFSLPFDLFETEGEMYLEKLGIGKADLIDAFRPEHDLSGPPTQADLDMAYACLKVNETERTLIFQPDPLNQTTYWGNLASGTSVELDLFMNMTGLDYGQVLSLLTLKSINPTQDSVILNDDLSCDTNKKSITNLTPEKFDIIHRFLRLWKKTSLTLEELDAIVQAPALGNGAITPPLAWQLQYFVQFQGLWSLSAFQYLAFFQNLDTTTPDNLFNQLFQNRAVTNQLNPDFAIIQVTSPSPMPISGGGHKSLIIGALGITPSDLDLLIAETDMNLSLGNLSYFYRMVQISQALSVSIADLLIFLDLISILPFTDPVTTNRFYAKWRTVVSSQFSAGDLNYVLRHQNDSAGALIPSDDQVATALGDLQAKLLQVQASTSVQDDPKGKLLKKWLTDPLLNWNSALVDKLMDILGTQDDTEYQQKIDNNNDYLLNLRVQYHDQTLTADLPALPALPAGVVFPDSLASSPVPSFASQISYDAPTRQLVLIGTMSSTDQSALKGLFNDPSDPHYLSYQNAVDQLYIAAQQTSSDSTNVFFATVADIYTNLRTLTRLPINQIAARYDWFLSRISPVYATIQQQNLIQKELSTWFKINKDVAVAIEASQPKIYTDFTDPTFVGKMNPLTVSNYPAQFNWYQKIAKICFIVGKLKLTADDLTWFLAHFADIHSLDFWNLPISSISGPVTTFDSFEVVINLLKFEQHFPAVQQVTPTATATVSVYTVIEEVIGGDPVSTIETDLCSLTGWDPAQLDPLINAPKNYLNLTLTDLKDGRILFRLYRCFTIMKNLGATAAACVAWTQASLSYENAVAIKQALQAQNQGDQWLAVTQPLQNTLREAKRDALVAYLLTNPPAGQEWQDSNDLYDYFLIDVEMSSCQPTSKIVQATNSVQQFVQRCFLNLEKNIAVDLTADPDWSQWEWMKYFRLWQANRKVFLYPENWIEPELLPVEIKSPFFKDLENDLLQNDVTQNNVETSFLNYLDQLDGVSRLEIKAMWYEDDKKTLHVVGRTYGGDPKIYYYRQFVENRRWTPWAKIDQDIASDHVVLTVFNHRIYLFWALFSEKSQDPSDADLTAPTASPAGTYSAPARPNKYWQIQMAFSEYKNGKWTPKKVSNNDETGWITTVLNSSGSPKPVLPDKTSLIFTPLDIPNFDITTYLDSSGKPKNPNLLSDILKGLETALEGNGDLRINCYSMICSSESSCRYRYWGTFDLDPCKGYPVVTSDKGSLVIPLFDQSYLNNMLDEAISPSEALAINGSQILTRTVGQFDNLVSLQMGFIDRLIYIIYHILYRPTALSAEEIPVTVGTFMPFFYQDKSTTYFVQPEVSDNACFEFTYQDIEDLLMAVLEQDRNTINEILATFPWGKPLFLMTHFYNSYHPLVCSFMRILFDQGIDALMSRDTQLQGDVIFDSSPDKFDFNQVFQPTTGLVYSVYSGSPVTYTLAGGRTVTDPTPGYPKGDADFDPKGGYSQYNWELFFHAPLMIAERLSQNQQFEDADHWFRYIFNPTDGSTYPSPDKYWATKPFFINVNDKYTQQNIQNIMRGIMGNNCGDESLVAEVADWRNNPFQPHYIAQYRTVAYQKTTVMKYLDHLIAWADSLYMQDTMESVFEAEQLYVLASQILGPKPLVIPPAFQTPVDNYYQLEQKLDAFSNALVDIENLLPLQQVKGYDATTPSKGLPSLETLYFCIPPNDNLMSYWDTVANRLYNIRHCLNLQGQFAPLALFAPPIEPGLLVRAAAAGLDIGSVLNDMNSPLPNYRFAVMIQKAIELCNEVKSLGSALLQAMEKKDAEDLALLRSSHGITVLNAVLLVRQQQVNEATHNLEALQQQQALVQVRIAYYQGLINAGLNNWETTSLNLSQTAIVGEGAAVAIEYLGNVMSLIPDFDVGAAGFGATPTAKVKFGGTQLGGAMRAMAGAIRGTAGVMHSQANVASMQATFERRNADWQFQLNVANAELQQVEKQILAATIRQSIANQEVQNQQLQITNAQSEDDFMHGKFTSTDLYAWMMEKLSTVYSESYRLAYGLAKQAEQTFRYELALGDSSYINFGYWNNLKKGLLAGDRLMYDIRNMEKAYHDQNAREYELTKHISLSQLDPSALQLLKTSINHECWINLPEELFDMDYPGHYMRRVKTVSLTIPCVAGPYTTVSCTLTMTRNSMRVSNISTDVAHYPRKTSNNVAADDPRFRDAVGAIQSIATSGAQNDNGLFEMNFRDERYLPFEGVGAISQWHLQLSPFPQFDYSTISDVIMHLKYTARDGGETLRETAATSLKASINTMLVGQGLMLAFSARHEFPTAWYAFLNLTSGDQVLSLNIATDKFPYFASMAHIKIKKVELIADTTLSTINVQVTPTPHNTPPPDMTQNGYTPMLSLILDYSANKQDPGVWKITNVAANTRLTNDNLNDLIVIVHYDISL